MIKDNEWVTFEQTIHLLESVLKENKRLGELLEEKHEEWLELMDKTKNQEGLSQDDMFNGEKPNEGEVYLAIGLGGAVRVNVARSTDEAIEILTEYGTNYSVSKKPEIPKFVAEWIEFKKKSGISYENVFQAIDELVKSHTSKVRNWVLKTNENKDAFARAWLYGFTVKKEPLYRQG